MLQKAELSAEADPENNLGGSSETMYFIGLDVHKKTISFCMKDAAGCVLKEGKIGATRQELYTWLWTLQAADVRHGSDTIHRVDLRLPASPR